MDALRRLLQRPTLPGLLVVLAAVLIFANSLPAEFVLDDYPAVVTNRGAQWPPDWSGIWLKNYWGSPDNYKSLTIYRPLATLTFAITDGLGGGGCPACHRWVNIGLHALSSLLVLLLAWHLCAAVVPPQRKPGTARALAATAAGLLFALHPVHTEAVVGVVSRAELLAALFVLLGTLMLLRLRVGRAPLLAIVYALALLSKENGATLWAVAMGYHLAAYAAERFGRGTRLDRRELWLHAVFAAVLLFYMALRSQAVEGLLAGDLSPSDNPIAEAGLLARIASPFMVLYQYVALLVAPATLTIDYSLNHVPPVLSVADLRFWAGLALFAGSLAALWAAVRRRFAVAFVLLGFYATYVVVSNTLFLSTIIMAERLIYLPSAFFVLLLVLGCLPVVLRLDARGRGVVTALLVAVLALFGVRTVERNAHVPLPVGRGHGPAERQVPPPAGQRAPGSRPGPRRARTLRGGIGH